MGVFLPVRIELRGKLHMGSVVSISAAGMLIKTDAPCVPGERVLVQLLLDTAPVTVGAEVARLTSTGVAFRFDAADFALQRTIRTVVTSVTQQT